MDEVTFQLELHSLQDRVADMIARHAGSAWSPRRASPVAPQKIFNMQVDDLKHHMRRLEGQLELLGKTQLDAAARPLSTSCDTTSPGQACLFPGGDADHTHPMVNSDLEILQRRLSKTERDLSDVEDRLDRLEVNRFTPTSSEASYRETSGPQITDNHFRETVSERSTRATGNDSNFPEAVREPFAPMTSVPHDKKSPPLPPGQVAEHLLSIKLEAATVGIDMLRKFNDLIAGGRVLDRSSSTLVCRLLELQTTLADDHSWNAPRLPLSSREDIATMSKKPLRRGPIPASELAAPDAEPLEAAQQLASPITPLKHEGVVFRDQEIARLDDLLRDAQDSARTSEQQACENKAAVQELQAQQEVRERDLLQLRNRENEREATMVRMKVDAAQRELHLQYLNDYLQTRDEQRERYLENHEQVVEESREKSNVIRSQQSRIDELERLLYDCQNTKDDEIDSMVQGREKEIRRLQHFCEDKDAVLRSQEDIIARGAELMQQRDAEIESMASRNKRLQDVCDHELRQRERLRSLLEERDSELAILRKQGPVAAASPSGQPPDQSSNSTPTLPAPRTQSRDRRSPFESSADTAADWSPRPIAGDRRLANETRRASAWTPAPSRPGPVFGEPSPLGASTDHPNLPGPPLSPTSKTVRQSKDASRRYRSSPHPRKAHDTAAGADIDEGELGAAAPARAMQRSHGHQPDSPRLRDRELQKASRDALSGSPVAWEQPNSRRRTQQRYSLPLDRADWAAQPGANRMHSMVDMRAAASAEREPHVSRHRSMHDLKRRNLQAYVETEVESSGEMGGEV